MTTVPKIDKEIENIHGFFFHALSNNEVRNIPNMPRLQLCYSSFYYELTELCFFLYSSYSYSPCYHECLGEKSFHEGKVTVSLMFFPGISLTFAVLVDLMKVVELTFNLSHIAQ